jgi:hypothetical protein
MGREVIVIGDKVLVKPEEEASKTPSGLRSWAATW